MNRRTFLATTAAVSVTGGQGSFAQFSPRVARLIIPLAPGGATDPYGRLIADTMSRKLGVPVIVEHKPGGGGLVGSQFVADQPADGNLLLLSTQAIMEILPNAQRDLKWSLDSFILRSFAALPRRSCWSQIQPCRPRLLRS